MKLKQIIIGLVVALCVVVVFFLIHSHQTATASGGEEENAPSIVSVQVGALKRATLHSYVEGYGTIEAAPTTADQPAAGAPLAPPAAGVVARINAVAGQQVKQGDVLIELNSGTMNVEYAREQLARQQKLYEQHNTSLKNLQDAEAQLAALRVVAPMSGTLTRLNVRPGQAVDMNTIVAELADLNRLAVTANIPASDMSSLKTGEDLELLTEPHVSTKVSFISPAVDANNDTVSVLGLLPADSGLRPVQFVRLRIVTAVHTGCLAAPEASVITDIDGHSVLSLVRGNEAVQTSVQAGFHENGWVEVSAPGLKEGDSVVTVGAYGLPEKTQINIVNSPAATASTNFSSTGAQ